MKNLLTLFILLSFAQADLKGSKPNIILIMTDDQGYGDLACHGHPFLKTPNLDKLYKQSTRFTDFQASPTCAPTRGALMTGKLPFKLGITHTILGKERMNLKTKTIAQLLKKASYTTGIFGKWHLGDEDRYQPHNRGFDETFIHGSGAIGARADVNSNKKRYFDSIFRHNTTFVKTKGYCTDVIFKQALSWIKECKDKKEPFFAYIPTNAPHAPFIVDKKYQDMYNKNVADKDLASFFGMITNIDDNIGLLMQKIDAWNLSDNTLVIFMTDNGSVYGNIAYNAKMKGRKDTVNEGGTRVPLFIRLPNKIKANLSLDNLTRHVDIFPTLADFAGVDISQEKDLDGISLLPLLQDSKAKWPDRMLFFHRGRWKGAYDKHKFKNFAIRKGKWRLVGNGLYNIKDDPGEKNDVSMQNKELVKEMKTAYEIWWDDMTKHFVNDDNKYNKREYIEAYNKQKQATGIIDWKEPSLD